MTISEPMTVVTDLLLAGWCGYLGGRLLLGGTGPARRWWGGGFLASALAALAGGVWHGVAHSLGPAAAAALWTLTLWSIGMASACFLAAAAQAVLVDPWRRRLQLAAAGKLLLYLGGSLGRDDFLPALLDYAPTLLLILLGFAWRYRHKRVPAAPWVCGGILTAFLAAAIQATRISPHPAFNHNDLYHLLQMLAFWLLYRGGLLLEQRA